MSMTRSLRAALQVASAFAFAFVPAPPLRAQVVHALRVADLVKEERPPLDDGGRFWWGHFVDVERLLHALADVRVEGGEGVLAFDHVMGGDDPSRWRVLVKTAAGAPAHGELWLPGRDPKSGARRLDRVPFTFPADAPEVGAEAFEAAVKRRAAFRAALVLPGTPLFQALAEGAPPDDPNAPPGTQSWFWVGPLGATTAFDRSEFGDSFELFSGGRALQENLQIDRMREVDPKGGEQVAVASIEGITTTAIDWKTRLGAEKPAIEPLAQWVPADQIYVGFDSFASMVALLDEMEKRGDTLVHVLEPRSEDAGTRGRLERQLCLATTAIARLLGPTLVRSVAFTASDPYLREGTDVAVLFDCVSTDALALQLAANWKEARAAVPGCADVEGEHGGVKIRGVASSDRRVSSFFAADGSVAIVANSRPALERLLDLHAGKLAGVTSLGASDEMAFFRGRYPVAGGAAGRGLVVLSDPFLRRFCGPAWRIGESRRLRCAAVLARLEGMRAAGASEDAESLAKRAGLRCPVDAAARFEFADGGARCSIHGGAGFLTPVSELPVATATTAERDAYVRFRSNYESYWRQYFDPIALAFETGDPLAADFTVLPLIRGTEYAQMRDFAGGTGGLTPKHGDPHDALLHLLLHVNPESELLKEFGGFFDQLPGVPGAQSKGLSWLGDSVELFLDDGPFWDELMKGAADLDAAAEFLQKNGRAIPFGISLSIRNPLAFTGIVVAMRAFVEQSMPNQLLWETREHAGLSYVVVKPRPSAESPFGEEFANAQVCYGSSGSRFWLSLDEGVLQRALERAAARNNAALPEAERDPKIAPPPPPAAWPGQHASASVAVARLQIVMRLLTPRDSDRDEVACFANLPLLEELRRRAPDADPVATAFRHFGVRPVCPNGGSYAVDAGLRALACTKHGHPTDPHRVDERPAALAGLARIAAGLTFEKDGLRLRFEANRKH